MQGWEPLGAHRYRVEGDTAFFEVQGPISVEEMEEHLSRQEAIAREIGWALTVYDSRQGTGVSAEVRRYVAERMRTRPFRAAGAVFGASFVIRTMVMLMVRAVSLFTNTGQFVGYFKTEAEAIEYCADMRELFRAEIARERTRG